MQDNEAMVARSTLIFDTSALNALADDLESQLIVKSLAIGFKVRLTQTNISEIVASTKSERRMCLLSLCRHLIHDGEGIKRYTEIVQSLAHAHAMNPDGFDWRRVEIRWPELEEEVSRQQFLDDADWAKEVRAENRLLQGQFETMWREARAQVGPPLRTAGTQRISLEMALNEIQKPSGPIWRLVRDIYKTGTGQSLTEPQAKRFAETCPPTMALLCAVIIGQFQWGLKDSTEVARYRAGALDLFSAAYLPYCDKFVTKDSGQFNAMAVVAEKAGLATKVCSYTDFRSDLLLIAA